MIASIIERLLYFDDETGPDLYPDGSKVYKNGRRWRRWPTAGLWNGRAFVGWTVQLVQFAGKPQVPRVVKYLHLQLVYDLWKWRVTQSHDYYDGPHCSYQFGPLELTKSWGLCRKCDEG